MVTKLTIFFLSLLLASYSLQAQPRLAMLAKPGKMAVELRWAPTDFEAWQHGIKNGYVIERSTILKNGKLLELVERKILTPNPIMLAEKSEWEKYENDNYAMVAGECIFGEYEDAETNFLPLKAYKKRQDEERRFGFALYSADMSAVAAKLSGLYFKDETANPDEKYLYKVTFANADSLIADTAMVFTGISEYQPVSAPEKPYFYCEQQKIVLWWQISKYQKFNSYYIEKSTDNGKTFNRLNETPIAIPMQGKNDKIFYSDTLIQKGLTYQYRIIGVDSFSEESPASEALTAKLQVPFEKVPDFADIKTVNNNSVELTWYYQTSAEIKGFKIYRSKSLKDKKILIYKGLNPSETNYTDNNPNYDNYYFLSVYNDAEEKLNPFPFYAQLIDSIPPAKPSKPNGYCDSLGVVFLCWNAHPDEDVKGYRLFRSNSPDKNFMMCASKMIADTFYVDTINLNTLSKSVYYKINAVDSRDNQSELSETAEIKRFDKIPPIAPQFENISYKKNKVLISIIPSPSKDVEKYLIYRKLANEKDFDTLTVLSAGQLAFTDQTALSGETYHYGIQALDDSGNKSVITKMPFEMPKTDKDDAIVLKKKILSNDVTLIWTTPSRKTSSMVIVYKKVDDKPLKTYSQVSDGVSFTDRGLEIGITYSYCVRVVYADGSESDLSNEIKVEL